MFHLSFFFQPSHRAQVASCLPLHRSEDRLRRPQHLPSLKPSRRVPSCRSPILPAVKTQAVEASHTLLAVYFHSRFIVVKYTLNFYICQLFRRCEVEVLRDLHSGEPAEVHTSLLRKIFEQQETSHNLRSSLTKAQKRQAEEFGVNPGHDAPELRTAFHNCRPHPHRNP